MPAGPKDAAALEISGFSKEPQMRLKKSLNHIFRSCLLLLLTTVQRENKSGDPPRPWSGSGPHGAGGLAALSFSITVKYEPSAWLVSHPIHCRFCFLGPRQCCLGFQNRRTILNVKLTYLRDLFLRRRPRHSSVSRHPPSEAVQCTVPSVCCDSWLE